MGGWSSLAVPLFKRSLMTLYRRKVIVLKTLTLSLVLMMTFEALFSISHVQRNYHQAEEFVMSNDLVEEDTRNNVNRNDTETPINKSALFFVEYPKLDYSSHFHVYPEHVDLRVIVLAYKNSDSLQKVLDSLQNLILDGDDGVIEIWIDRDSRGKLDNATLQVARKFRWARGPVRLHVQSRRVGSQGQWMQTWRPQLVNDYGDIPTKTELALYLDDRTDVSPYAYRWLRAAYTRYGAWSDVSGFGLQDTNIIVSSGAHMGTQMTHPKGELVFLSELPGFWGMSPLPGIWRKFQDWLLEMRKTQDFKPYVSGAKYHTNWYKKLERRMRQHAMWSMWFLKFTADHRLCTLYSNIPAFTGRDDVSLISIRKVRRIGQNSTVQEMPSPKLMMDWDDKYIQFPDKPNKYGFDGEKT